MRHPDRRTFLRLSAAGACAGVLARPAIAQGAGGRVVVVGGGFAGATCARFLKQLDPRLNVTLLEMSRTFTACPFSNGVIAGLRELSAQEFGYDRLQRAQLAVTFASATAVDPQARTVTLADGA